MKLAVMRHVQAKYEPAFGPFAPRFQNRNHNPLAHHRKHSWRGGDCVCRFDVLACLRTSDKERAIQRLEQDMEEKVVLMTQDLDGKLTKAGLTSSQQEALAWVRIYRKSYPSSSQQGTRIDRFLSTLPDPLVTPSCPSAICALYRQQRNTPATNESQVPAVRSTRTDRP
jgi:hypothetical protein